MAALQTEPLPDKPAPGFHPGLFGVVTTGQEPIPPVDNTYETGERAESNMSPMISYSFHQGNVSTGENASVTGFILESPVNTSVNITGRGAVSQPFRYLTTVQPDERGFFAWDLPQWASDITEVMVGIARK